MDNKKNELNKIQFEYYQLLSKKLPEMYKGNFENLKKATLLQLIDEIKIFWRKKISLVEFELENSINSTENLLLSGSVYLDVKSNEHYHFSLFADYNIVDDPLLKLESLIRYSDQEIIDSQMIAIFKKAYNDALEISEKYSDVIYILPIREIISKDFDKNQELINSFYWKFISYILNVQLKDEIDFFDKFKKIEDLETEMDDYLLNSLIFTDMNDSKLSLKEKCDKYKKNNPQFRKMNSVEIFNIATYSYIAQIVDMLINASIFGFTPYIRNNITFKYLILLMNSFLEDKQIKHTIMKSIILHISYNVIPLDELTKYDFFEFTKKTEKRNMLFNIIESLKSSNNDFFQIDIDVIKEIMIEKVHKAI